MKFKPEFYINKRKISLKNPTYFIADISANHDGKLDRAKKLIYLAKKSGADAVKFQHFLAPKIVSDYGFKKLGKNIGHQSKWKKSVYKIYEKYSLNRNWDKILYDYSKKVGIEWMTTPYDYEALNKINKYSSAFKIGSGDITWLEFIKEISKKKKPIMLATGASSLIDVKRAVNVISKFNKKICLMQCNTNYTNNRKNFKHINLRVLNLFKKEFPNIILGLSDHTEGHATVLGSIVLGARIIEKHFTDNNNRTGPDHYFSMNPKSWNEMIKRSRELEDALGVDKKNIEKNEKSTVLIQRRCLRLNKNMLAGTKIYRDDIDVLRPATKDSYLPFEINKVINKKLRRNKSKGSNISKGDLF